MKKYIPVIVLTLLLCSSLVFAADSTGTPQGTAVQPDYDLKGSNLLNADSVNSKALNTKDINATGQVSAGVVIAPSGAITNLNTGKILIESLPVGGTDGTNKAYVDSQDTSLQSKINTLESDVTALKNESASSGGGGGIAGTATFLLTQSDGNAFYANHASFRTSNGLSISYAGGCYPNAIYCSQYNVDISPPLSYTPSAIFTHTNLDMYSCLVSSWPGFQSFNLTYSVVSASPSRIVVQVLAGNANPRYCNFLTCKSPQYKLVIFD